MSAVLFMILSQSQKYHLAHNRGSINICSKNLNKQMNKLVILRLLINYYYPHFKDEEFEAQRNKLT